MYRGEGRIPPYSSEAERSVLGSILLNNRCIVEVLAEITSDDFYIESHRRVFETMQEMDKGGTTIDHVTLGNALTEKGDLEKIGGVMALDGLTSAVATTANVMHYASIVRKKAAVRRVIYTAQELVADGFGDDGNTENLEDGIVKVVDASAYLARTHMPDSMGIHAQRVLDTYLKVASGYRGIQLPWPTLDDMTAGMWPKTLTMFVARPGTGKCHRHDTLVMCSDTGKYRTIADVVRDRGDVLTRRLDGGIVSVTPDAWLDMGEKECLRVKTYSGKGFSATPEHPVMTVDGWTRMDNLRVGDYVEQVGIVPEPKKCISVDDNESIVAGFMVADGNLSSWFGFTKSDGVIVSMLRSLLSEHGCPLVQSVIGKDDGRFRINNSSKFSSLWRGWGFDRSSPKNKFLPDRIFQYDNESLAKFLGALWSCDGSFPLRKSSGIRYRTAEITCASHRLVDQLQRLFLRFGIHGRVRKKNPRCNDKRWDAWTYTVYRTSFDRFQKHIPIWGGKACQLEELVCSENPNIDNIPITPRMRSDLIEFIETFDDEDRVKMYEEVSALLGMTTRFSVNKIYRRNTVNRRVFEAFIDVFGADQWRHLLENHWDRVESIEEDGIHRVYDLTVMDGHAYVAEDFVVHNTFVAVICARHAWMMGKRVLIVSPEMSKDEIAERFFVIQAGVSYKDIVAGDLSDFEMPNFKKVIDEAASMDNLWIMDSDDDLSPRGIEAAIRACKPELVAVDSIYDLRIKGDRRERAIGALEWMKRAAKQFEFACCGFGQQNRTAELSERKGGGARLGTIALADEIGQDAHAVFALEQTKDDKIANILKFKPLKLRRGQMLKSMIRSSWDFDKMNFLEIKDEEEDDDYKDDPHDF